MPLQYWDEVCYDNPSVGATWGSTYTWGSFPSAVTARTVFAITDTSIFYQYYSSSGDKQRIIVIMASSLPDFPWFDIIADPTSVGVTWNKLIQRFDNF